MKVTQLVQVLLHPWVAHYRGRSDSSESGFTTSPPYMAFRLKDQFRMSTFFQTLPLSILQKLKQILEDWKVFILQVFFPLSSSQGSLRTAHFSSVHSPDKGDGRQNPGHETAAFAGAWCSIFLPSRSKGGTWATALSMAVAGSTVEALCGTPPIKPLLMAKPDERSGICAS